jgi:hypothetical protein
MEWEGSAPSDAGAAGRRSRAAPWLLASALYLGLTAFLFAPVLACLDRCYVDLPALHPGVGAFELNDTRLNTWILAWVQHALLTRPFDLFQANAFHPAPDMLAGSEHLLGLAVPMLPLRLFSSNAVLVYQATLVLTSGLIALTTFALARWLTGMLLVPLLAGTFALFMPWRTAELTHIQLLGAHWFPLVWLLALRILLGEQRRLDGVGLAVVLSLQLLTSFYLAYQLAFELVLLVAVVGLCGRLRLGSLRRLALAAAAPFALLLASSLPYLARSGQGELPSQAGFLAAAGTDNIVRVARFLAPRLPGLRDTAFEYWVPATLLVLGGLGIGFAFRRPRPEDTLGERRRVASLFLGACVAASLVMMLGPAISVGGVTVPLPHGWAAWWVPGYANVRAPSRWGVTISVAMPVLAAVGLRGVLAVFPPRPRARRLALAALLLLLLVDLPWRGPLPARPVWWDAAREEALYTAVRELPPGPVLELPWPVDPLVSIGHDSRYLLASTLHWKPILNGFTAYAPPSFDFLRRLARRLPEADALARLVRATGLRWVVVHFDPRSADLRNAWQEAEAAGRVRLVRADDRAAVYEIPVTEDSGEWLPHLVSPDADRTLSGLERAPLELPIPAGRIELLARPRPRFLGTSPLRRPFRLRVSNDSDLDWPGFDAWSEGLVELRAVYSDLQDRVVHVETAPLDVDVPARSSVEVRPLVTSPTQPGRFRLCLDLVQTLGDERRVLPVPPIEVEVEVTGVAPKYEGWAAGLADASREPTGLETELSRCALRRGPRMAPAAAH